MDRTIIKWVEEEKYKLTEISLNKAKNAKEGTTAADLEFLFQRGKNEKRLGLRFVFGDSIEEVKAGLNQIAEHAQ